MRRIIGIIVSTLLLWCGASWACARDAAWSAARDAAWGASWCASWCAARDAVWSAEVKWQRNHFNEMLGATMGVVKKK